MPPEGIYYRKNPPIGNSFCIISLRAERSNAEDIGFSLANIWVRLSKLKRGITPEFHTDLKHRKTGNLSVLLGYGSKIFEIPGCKRTRPASFTDTWNFNQPKSEGGGPVIEGAQMKYSENITENHLLTDHFIIQFIADNEFFTNRAVVEVWRELRRLQKENGHAPLSIKGFYTGFQRADKRNWLGFHDGISNLKSHERPYAILINSRQVNSTDKWTVNGTYLAFMSIIVDLERWDDISRSKQEMIIGRDKVTGCPIELDGNGVPRRIRGCPVPSTSEIIDVGNERFREVQYSNKMLKNSHISSTRSTDQIPVWDKRSFRIFRQGFEFMSQLKHPFTLTPGLNFVSFQNSPERLFRTLTYHKTFLKNKVLDEKASSLDAFLSVLVAGIFFVPPLLPGEPFPGSQIFGQEKNLTIVKKFE